jgi:hypothetical protein
MYKGRNLFVAILLGLTFGAVWLYTQRPAPANDPLHMEEGGQPQQATGELEKRVSVDTLAKDATIIPYEANPQEPVFNAPCPMDTALQKDVNTRMLPIGFEGEAGKRPWQSIVSIIESSRSWSSIHTKLRELVMLLLKLQSPAIYKLMGVSEAVDLLEITKTAICDEIALVHHRVQNGIDPLLGQDFTDHQTMELDKHERILLEVMYRSCRMAASNAFRYGQATFTRVAFEPSPNDWPLILKGLAIDPHKPGEMVCTYRPRKP